MTTRGIRNNNPGNIRKSKDKWQGLAETQPDKEFFTFVDPTYGIRAIARILIKYQDDYGLTSVNALINRWAPPVENNTKAYIARVAKDIGVSPSEEVNVHEFEVLYPLVVAIISHECGSQPYSKAQITKGLVLAGVEPQNHKDKTIAKTNTVKVATVAGAATVASPILDTLNKVEEHSWAIDKLEAYGPWALAAVVLAALGFFIYTRWDDRRKGLR